MEGLPGHIMFPSLSSLALPSKSSVFILIPCSGSSHVTEWGKDKGERRKGGETDIGVSHADSIGGPYQRVASVNTNVNNVVGVKLHRF